jgi:hypothetical protein
MNEEKTRLRDTLGSDLAQYTGTDEYHRIRYPWLRKNFLLTDGTKYLADKAGAYWLIDIIASHQTNKKVAAEEFQTWKLYVNRVSAQIERDPGKMMTVQAVLEDTRNLSSLVQADLFTFSAPEPEPDKPIELDEPTQALPANVLAWQKHAANNAAIIICDDGDKHLLVSQEIPFTDFPLDEITLYVTNDDFNGIVVMLPSEY